MESIDESLYETNCILLDCSLSQLQENVEQVMQCRERADSSVLNNVCATHTNSLTLGQKVNQTDKSIQDALAKLEYITKLVEDDGVREDNPMKIRHHNQLKEYKNQFLLLRESIHSKRSSREQDGIIQNSQQILSEPNRAAKKREKKEEDPQTRKQKNEEQETLLFADLMAMEEQNTNMVKKLIAQAENCIEIGQKTAVELKKQEEKFRDIARLNNEIKADLNQVFREINKYYSIARKDLCVFWCVIIGSIIATVALCGVIFVPIIIKALVIAKNSNSNGKITPRNVSLTTKSLRIWETVSYHQEATPSTITHKSSAPAKYDMAIRARVAVQDLHRTERHNLDSQQQQRNNKAKT